jgi:RNase P subunit RPR2
MKKAISKTEANKLIDVFCKDIKCKTSKDVRKIKRLAMSHNIPLKEKKRLFCKKCMTPYSGKERIRIKNKMKSVTCEKCGNVNRWKIININSS